MENEQSALQEKVKEQHLTIIKLEAACQSAVNECAVYQRLLEDYSEFDGVIPPNLKEAFTGQLESIKLSLTRVLKPE